MYQLRKNTCTQAETGSHLKISQLLSTCNFNFTSLSSTSPTQDTPQCSFLFRLNVSCIFSVTWSAGDVKEPTHLSKRVGGVVPGVVVYLLFHCTFHAWAGWVSEIKYGLIAAARGAFTS